MNTRAYHSEQCPMLNVVPLCVLALTLSYAIAAEADGVASGLDGNWTVNSLHWPSDGETQLACCLRTILYSRATATNKCFPRPHRIFPRR